MSDEMGCLDSFCYLKGKAKGMHTNGGCRCVRNLVGRDNPAAGFAIEKRLSELHNIIESLHTQLAVSEAGEWVPVSERLPEPRQDVIYYSEFVGRWVGQYLGDGTNNVFGGKFGFLTDDVTHWMPLPTPPSEED